MRSDYTIVLMKPIEKHYRELKKDLDKSLKTIGLDSIGKEIGELDKMTQDPKLWDDPEKGRKTTEKLSRLHQKIEPWRELQAEIDEIGELISLKDESLDKEIESQLDKFEKKLDELRESLAYSGPYDDGNVLLSIHAGAGGVDAQDWASLLLRMYLRWAEKSGFKTRVIDESAGEEAGLKSVSVEVKGSLAYGKLKGEHGIHRLVRLSPFNANNLRQTSFAKVEVLPEIDEPSSVPIDEKDLKVDVFRAGGHGGQSVNTTDSAVRITHLPTGITVSIQNERSQIQNKETAMTVLRSKLAQLQLEQHKDNIAEIKGPDKSAEWGNQIRSYVLHPYSMVKDLRTKHETSNTQAVLDGEIDDFINAYVSHAMDN